jgi:FMN phosphatase YigB (HAD superfamily)
MLPRAVLFDLDGTLYYQSALRLLMAPDLARLALIDCGRSARALLVFRRVRERLRSLGASAESLDRLQYTEPARELGCDPRWLEGLVREWILRRPLSRLRHCRRRGVLEFLDALEAQSIRVGVFSDYPTRDKLTALGLSGRFSIELVATDAEVNAFKPHPRGFLVACERWALPPEDILYIGDRPEVDATGAARTGMRATILAAGAGFGRLAQELVHA